MRVNDSTVGELLAVLLLGKSAATVMLTSSGCRRSQAVKSALCAKFLALAGQLVGIECGLGAYRLDSFDVCLGLKIGW